MRKLVCILIIALPFLGFTWRDSGVHAPKMKLSEYGFFKGDIARQEPADGVMPYHLNTPLFTDHAEKLRFVKLPEGTSVIYNDTAVFDFPVGTALVKTFYYPIDFFW